jgi:hypothetical protein
MRQLVGLVLAALFVIDFVAPTELKGESKKKQPDVAEYTLELIDAPDVRDINNREQVLIERQLVQGATPVPLIVKRNGKETAFECTGTTNDTTGEGINNRGDIVGHCGHNPPGNPLAFVGNPLTGSQVLLAYPGAWATWGYGINDYGQVVGFYDNVTPQSNRFHSFAWDPATNQYFTIDNPLAQLVGGWTWLRGINNKGQMVGHYNTQENVPFEEYQFIYDKGTFTPIEFPGARQTHITGFNNESQVFGWYADLTEECRLLCLFRFDRGEYFKITLPLPANEPRPDCAPASVPRVISVGGLNDKGQFVGEYGRITSWVTDEFGTVFPVWEYYRFVATPQKPGTARHPSPEGTRIPGAAAIYDSDLVKWTLGPSQEILRHGRQARGGYGSQILWYGGQIYVVGDDNNWWQWIGNTWVLFGPDDPSLIGCSPSR